MLYVCYDFSDDKVRAKFARFLSKYGRKVQYSVYEIKNSQRVLKNILNEVEYKYSPRFTGADSIIIIPISNADRSKVIRYGFAQNDDEDILFFG
ncbi:MAG: CRISPR-associated endonuclease Cas2 [Candidatus Kaiserbacteria bacterium]|nr:CRISPR-associated endonuclease Cas2 [Candidatus Kaiserbacteria bacterium]